jgi:signal transduction histidine kinase
MSDEKNRIDLLTAENELLKEKLAEQEKKSISEIIKLQKELAEHNVKYQGIINFYKEMSELARKAPNIEKNDDRKKINEKDLEESNKKLIELNEKKDRFFSIIAHDLKGPIYGFVGLTRLMTEEFDSLSSEEMLEYTKTIHNSANHIYKLLINLLDWLKSRTGTLDFKPELLNLNDTIQRQLNLLKDYYQKKNIEINIDIPYKMFVNADRVMFDTILNNLLSNSIKFSNQGGKVKVSVSESPDYTLISVSDEGIGISDKILQKLFKIDEQVKTKGTEGELSTGLGLILCKEFVELHKGKIWVDSKKDFGSTFYVEFPKN